MTKQVETVGNQTVNHIYKLNEGIKKSFDNIMFQQTKMDNKAYIFIGFLGAILGIINKNGVSENPINWICGLAMFCLLLSLVPITNKLIIGILEKIIKKQILQSHNIFYYNDIYFLNVEEFKNVLKCEYQLGYYTKFELKLIEQILINARILHVKVFCHNCAHILIVLSALIYCIYLLGSSIFSILK